MFLSLLSFILLLISSSFAEDYQTLTISTGSIRGRLAKSTKGQKGFAFLGIPYVAPPLGSLRFKAPQPAQPWSGIIDCLDYKASCPQWKNKTHAPESVPITEDCMFMNVFTSRRCLEKGNCSVIAYIHGGGRLYMTTAAVPVENIITNYANDKQNIVFVNIPYRLGIFAWLNLAPGMKTSADTNLPNRDIVYGLQWIQNEISHFGGNPLHVTLVCHSSGATTCTEIILAKVADGLFSQIALYSGLYNGQRFLETNSIASRKIAELVNCAPTNYDYSSKNRVEKVEDCLRNISWERILEAQNICNSDLEDINGLYIDGPGGMFPTTFKEAFERKLPKYNVLLGTLSAESKDTRFLVTSDGQINQTRLDHLCSHLAYEENYERPEEFRRVCNEYYSNVERACSLADDKIYYYPAGMYADKFSNNGTVFVCSFEYPIYGSHFTWNSTKVTPAHAADLIFLLWGNHSSFTEKEFKIEEIYTDMLVNFANTGEPGYGWKPWTKKNREYFVIDFDENLNISGSKIGYNSDVAKFYDETVLRAAGISQPAIDMAFGQDTYSIYTLIRSYMQEFLDKHHLCNIKSVETCRLVHKYYDDHLDHLKSLAVRLDSGGLNTLLVIILSVCGILIAGVALLGYRQWRKRKEYAQFD